MKSTLRFLGAVGTVTGSRHLLETRGKRLPNPLATVLFVGYQAEGTRGRTLREGKSHLRMFGQDVEVRARVEAMDGFSGHADYLEMLAWLMAFNKPVFPPTANLPPRNPCKRRSGRSFAGQSPCRAKGRPSKSTSRRASPHVEYKEHFH